MSSRRPPARKARAQRTGVPASVPDVLTPRRGGVAGGSVGRTARTRTVCAVRHGPQCPPVEVGAARLTTVAPSASARTVTRKLIWTVPPTGIGGTAQVDGVAVQGQAGRERDDDRCITQHVGEVVLCGGTDDGLTALVLAIRV